MHYSLNKALLADHPRGLLYCFFHAKSGGSETRQEFRWLGRIHSDLPLEVTESLRGFRYAKTPTLRPDIALIRFYPEQDSFCRANGSATATGRTRHWDHKPPSEQINLSQAVKLKTRPGSDKA